MRAFTMLAVTALALSSCQSPEEKRAAETGEIEAANATMDQIAGLTKAARAKSRLQPGQWRTELRVVSADLSAFPEGPKRDAQLEAIKATERNAQGCRTADQLKPLDFESIEEVAGECVFPRYIQKDGRIDVEIHCGEGAAKTVIQARGVLSPTGYDVTMEQVTGAKGAANYLGLKLEAVGRRVGNCTPQGQG